MAAGPNYRPASGASCNPCHVSSSAYPVAGVTDLAPRLSLPPHSGFTAYPSNFLSVQKVSLKSEKIQSGSCWVVVVVVVMSSLSLLLLRLLPSHFIHLVAIARSIVLLRRFLLPQAAVTSLLPSLPPSVPPSLTACLPSPFRHLPSDMR